MVAISLKKNTMFFIYTAPSSILEKLPREKKTKIGFCHQYDIRKYDIIYFFKKKETEAYFTNFAYIMSKQTKNINDVHVHKDIEMSKYYCECIIFDLPKRITIPKVFDKIKQNDKKYYDKSINFSKKIVPQMALAQIIDRRSGRNLFKYFVSIRKKDKEKKKEEEDKLKYSEHIDSESSVKSRKSYGSGLQENYDDEDSDDDTDRYIIPVCIIFCKQLNIKTEDDKEKLDIILDHFRKCKSCEVINNNNFNALIKFNNKTIFKEIIDESEDLNLEEVIESYHHDECYIYEKRTNIPNILYYVKDPMSRYDDCGFFVGRF